jgi:hypothetical protein
MDETLYAGAQDKESRQWCCVPLSATNLMTAAQEAIRVEHSENETLGLGRALRKS